MRQSERASVKAGQPIWWRRDWVVVLLLVVVYVVTARLGLLLALPPGKKATAVWLPSGVAFGAVLFFGRRVWPGIWLGAFLANLWDFLDPNNQHFLSSHVLVSSGIALGSTLQALAGIGMLHRWVGRSNPLDRVPNVLAFITIALLMCLVASTLGVTSLCLGGFVPWAVAGATWWTWWLGDTAGVLLVAPLLLAWIKAERLVVKPWRLVNGVLLLTLLMIVGLPIFGGWGVFGARATPLAYLTLPLLVWATVDFGQRGATTILLLISVMAVWGTVNGSGPFIRPTLNESLLLLQIFVGVLTLTALVLAAALTERQRVASQHLGLLKKMKEADRRKDEFLATLAHELRNPLAPLRNAAQVLRIMNLADPQLRGVRDIIDRQVQQMARLVDDLLDASRLTRGKVQLRKERCDLSAAMQSAVEAVRPTIDAQAHQLTVTLPGEPVQLYADPARLTQIVSNLLHNAATYMEKGGQIWLTAERQGTEAVVSVRDTGMGIASEHLPHLFEMFSQVVPALERSHSGLGIGLALVKGLVELHGGRVEAISGGPGKGSEFRVYLPILDAPVQRAEDPGRSEKSPTPCRVLVADDLPDSVESLAMMLRLAGHEIATAHDGLEAVQTAATFRPDVILLDIGMPKMNGYEAARHVRQQTWGKSILLVALTGWGQEEDKRKAAEAGFDHHLTKPVNLNDLKRLLEPVALHRKREATSLPSQR